MSRSFFVLGFFVFCAVAGGAAAQDADTRFLSVLPEIPLPGDLSEHPGRAVLFDKPGGRIARATASGVIAPGEVLDFYARTLPSLGWSAEGDSDVLYMRGGESLVLEIEQEQTTVVHFLLNP
ncbi:MAG: hypothetical protein MPK06_06760 [Alphaproteobacteria bacterium]|nr:hypothetical protein [Alphaproteobacteria bacterium]MDA7984698.1 hypothetical protein [Alphaproteobacteria bacterium]MDA7988926.1 hypothetical protein [Alphaproteobacteria bacterium]MDA8000821.1 hypothetical protein [Alphaproteobacteria bacterium]MDA8004233.1 hypothetical protein [Alphaproteobacteria bacterium]